MYEEVEEKKKPIQNSSYVEWTGIIICTISIIFGIWITFYVCMYGGVVSIVTGFSTDPWSAGQIAFGVVRFFCAGIAGWLSFIFGFCAGSTVIAKSYRMQKEELELESLKKH